MQRDSVIRRLHAEVPARPGGRLPRGDGADALSGQGDGLRQLTSGLRDGVRVLRDGSDGLVRQLTAGEIVQQVVHANRVLVEQGQPPLRNVVLMGMGEPLHNYDAVMKAISILCEPAGLALAPRHITLSTVGIIPGIIRLADERQPVHLAVSLHAATQEERAKLVPPSRAWPLDELIAACHYYAEKMDRRIFFEWALIEGQNDSAEQAAALGILLHGLPSHVNLIPLNPIANYDGTPTSRESAKQFQAILTEHRIPSTIRQRRGIDIAAGCGQLAVSNTRELPLASFLA